MSGRRGGGKTRSFNFDAIAHVGNDADQGGFLGDEAAEEERRDTVPTSARAHGSLDRVPEQDGSSSNASPHQPAADKSVHVMHVEQDRETHATSSLGPAEDLSAQRASSPDGAGAVAEPSRSLAETLMSPDSRKRNDHSATFTPAGSEPPILRSPKPSQCEKKAPLQDAVLTSYMRAQKARDWKVWSGRLEPGVRARLAERVGNDCASSGRRKLAPGHYLDAALLRLPSDLEGQIAVADAFLDRRGGEHEPGEPISASVSPKVWEYLRGLKAATRGQRRGLIVQICSGALEELLDGLDGEGLLPQI
jgi:hypothetical protein